MLEKSIVLVLFNMKSSQKQKQCIVLYFFEKVVQNVSTLLPNALVFPLSSVKMETLLIFLIYLCHFFFVKKANERHGSEQTSSFFKR